MRLEEAIFAYLTGVASLTTLVSTRIYKIRVPQNPTYPCIRYTRISGTEEYSHDGATNWPTARLQFDCMGKSEADAARVADALRAALDAFPSPGLMGGAAGVRVDEVVVNFTVDGWDDDLEVCTVSLDVEISHAR